MQGGGERAEKRLESVEDPSYFANAQGARLSSLELIKLRN